MWFILLDMNRRRLNWKQAAWGILLFVAMMTAQIVQALGLPQWIIWVTIPIVVFAAIKVIAPVFKSNKARDEQIRSGASRGGTRFKRELGQNQNVLGIAESWAQKFGYKRHLMSTETKVVYTRSPLGMMPIFVALLT